MDIGIIFEHRTVRIAHVEPGSPADAMGLRRGDRLTHVGGIPVCNRDQIAATWQMLEELPRDHVTVLRQREVMHLPIPPWLHHPVFALDLPVDAFETGRVLDLRARQSFYAEVIAS